MNESNKRINPQQVATEQAWKQVECIDLEQFDINMDVVCCKLMRQHQEQRQALLDCLQSQLGKTASRESNSDQKRSLLKSKSTSCSQPTRGLNHSAHGLHQLDFNTRQVSSNIQNQLGLRRDQACSSEVSIPKYDKNKGSDQNQQQTVSSQKNQPSVAQIRNNKE